MKALSKGVSVFMGLRHGIVDLHSERVLICRKPLQNPGSPDPVLVWLSIATEPIAVTELTLPSRQ